MNDLDFQTATYFKFNPSKSNSRLTAVVYFDKLSAKKHSNSNVNSEFSMIQSLSHENIIKAYTQDTSNSFIMELCTQGDLMPKNPILVHSELVSTFRQLCKAVQYLHRLDICHLDLKLENFVKDDKNIIKLIDFEHAQRSSERVQDEKGTWLYNAPERTKGSYDGKKADIFSLGVCLMGLMVGFIPASSGKISFPNSQRFLNDNETFWDLLEISMMKNHKKFEYFEDDDVFLVNEMVDQDPDKRPSIDEVLENAFFRV